ncbi:DUF4124 domain-containing protein [Salinisphaera sp. Q1T1-3]|uniref:DUF4124 domain-containing protein n=1 Tax=Salinisphaera sp. Q1T1-3 TaxID=2321229 RepID=UPI001314F8F2|nr:DUF4124 domain-containing protein [Salinisphaera sp. Q1T1-3]
MQTHRRRRARLRVRCLIGLVFMGAAAPALATVYTWTDAKGVTHYSDRAGARGAEPMRLQVRALGDTTPHAVSAGDAKASTAATGSQSQATHAPRIVSPSSDAVIDAAAGSMVVSVAIGDDATLTPDETLVYRLDGRVLEAAPPTATRLAIDNLAPGRHQLSVTLARNGQEIGRQDAVTFTVAAADQSPSGDAATASYPGSTMR